ncbi:MAG: hypothetical protein E6J79_17000 [Deltaproteobacteria bacterium]|nr:MAG: hypothetical protein E6J79_17000 [Deltaproteobacteria bacterium]
MAKLASLFGGTRTLLAFAGTPYAAMAKTYQVTGPVFEVTNDMIAVQKGKDRWEIGRDASTKVTMEYRMTATSVEVKPASGAAAKSKSKAAK